MNISKGALGIMATIAIFLLFAVSVTRPVVLWTDEFLYFAFGAFDSTFQALQKVRASTANVNHGQTGFYMLLNHLMLQAFGASYFVLRLPSYLAFVVSLVLGCRYLRNCGFSSLACATFVLGMGLSQLNLQHAAEARPYMVLQATVVAALWAWQRTASLGRSLSPLLFVGVVGILFHPFFPLYLALIVFSGAALFPEQRKRLLVIWRGKGKASLVFTVVAWFVVFLVVGKFSWFQTLGKKHGMDPYAWIGQLKYPLPLSMLAVILGPSGKFWFPVMLAVALASWFRKRAIWISPAGKHLLQLVSIFCVTQALLVWVTLASQYWILQRQWIAGVALVFLACSMMLDLSLRALECRDQACRWAAAGALGLSIWISGFTIWRQSSAPLTPAISDAEYNALSARYLSVDTLDTGKLLEFARENLLRGGAVHPVFRVYYAEY